MKDYLILRDFSGSQNGIDSESFVAGTTRKLSDSLVTALGGPAGGFIRAADKAASEIAKAPPALADAVKDAIAEAGPQIVEGEAEKVEEVYLDDQPIDPAARETKVTGPEETKPEKAQARKGKR